MKRKELRFRHILLLCLLSALTLLSGCRGGTSEKSPGKQAALDRKETESATALPERFIRVSVYLTDTRTNKPINEASVSIGGEVLLPSGNAPEYGDIKMGGLYDTDLLEGGTYFFRASSEGYLTLAGSLTIPPVPEFIGPKRPPRTLALEDVIDADGDLPYMNALILWQNYKR